MDQVPSLFEINKYIKIVSSGIEYFQNKREPLKETLGFNFYDDMSVWCRERIKPDYGSCIIRWEKQFVSSSNVAHNDNNCRAYWALWCKYSIPIYKC